MGGQSDTYRFRAQNRRTRREVFPVLSRIQNIGHEMGGNDRTPEWYRVHLIPTQEHAAIKSVFG